MKKIHELTDAQKVSLINNRWASSDTVWDIVKKTYESNILVYKNEPEWLKELPRKKSKVRANRVFVNTEAVINSVIANPPKPTLLAGRNTPESKALVTNQEKFFQIKYDERNVKETMRKGLRNMYFSRLIVIKPYWDAKINDFNCRAIDPRKVRFAKNSTKEEDSEFALEEIEDNLAAVIKRFPEMKEKILEKYGYTDDSEVLIENPTVKYIEAWIWDYVIFKLENLILGCIKNPYWDWDGLLITPEEEQQLQEAVGEVRRNILSEIRNEQATRKSRALSNAQVVEEGGEKPQEDIVQVTETIPLEENITDPITYASYYFNHFDRPRKPYIFATMFNNENTPIGQTDMITQATPLQHDIDATKRNITENAKLVNGTLKVDSSVMSKSDAQGLSFQEPGGVVWGKGVTTGVVREFGTPLPAFVTENLNDSRREVDEIMAASSAFKGVREGQETKGGRLALVDQSFLRLNEMVQVVDYVNYELFNWFYQLAKTRYTEHHYAKTMGKEQAQETITLIQDDFEDGTEVRVIPGKTLPEDREFKYEQAQNDIKQGLLSPSDYFEIAGYATPMDKAKNRVIYDMNKAFSVGLTAEEMAKIAPPSPEDPPSLSIKYEDLPPDGKVQLAAKAGITLNPQIVVAEEMAKTRQKQDEAKMKAESKIPQGSIKSPIKVT